MFYLNYFCCKLIVLKFLRKIENVIFVKFNFINILVFGRDENKDVCIILVFCVLILFIYIDILKKKREKLKE